MEARMMVRLPNVGCLESAKTSNPTFFGVLGVLACNSIIIIYIKNAKSW